MSLAASSPFSVDDVPSPIGWGPFLLCGVYWWWMVMRVGGLTLRASDGMSGGSDGVVRFALYLNKLGVVGLDGSLRLYCNEFAAAFMA